MQKDKQVNKCLDCVEYKNCKDSFVSWVFFIIGIVATLAIRIVTVLIHLDPVYAKIAWYVGIIGFFLFFLYKFRVGQAQAKIVQQSGLAKKISQNQALEKRDYALISSILCSLSSRKERVNYFFIFALSAAALLLAIYIDLLK